MEEKIFKYLLTVESGGELLFFEKNESLNAQNDLNFFLNQASNIKKA